MRDPAKPDTQPDEYMPDAPNAHKQRRDLPDVPDADADAINPRDISSMPRSEDDLKTQANSPEFHDRTDIPDAGTAK